MKKKFEKLEKKRIWPSIVIFIAVTFFCMIMVGMFVSFFMTYVVTTKMESMYDKSLAFGENMDRLIDSGKTVPQAVEVLKDIMPQSSGIYITDENQNPIIMTGTSRPNLDVAENISLSEEVVVVGDSEENYRMEDVEDSLLNIPLREVFEGAFGRTKNEHDSERMHEIVLDKRFWLKMPLRHREYQFYIKHTMQIQRQDVLYMCSFSVLVVFMLLIPIIFLFISTIRAIVLQRKMTRKLYTDMITGGMNWGYFRNYATKILTRHRNRKKAYAVVYLRLDRYQNYCACYGAKKGEEVLESMDGFLMARMTREEIHARFEGADFALLLCCKGENEQEYRDYCQKRMCSLLAELTGLRPEQKLHFSAGVYLDCPKLSGKRGRYVDRKKIDISQLYNYANIARNGIKRQEKQNILFFDEGMLDKQLWRRIVEGNMESALLGEAFQVYLQPKYSPVDERIVGAEALVRWKFQTGEVLEPNRFIPIFEENGFITQLDDYMVSHVAKLQAERMIQGKKVVPVSINLSRAHFVQEGLAEHICQLVDAYGPRHDLIELEVVENVFNDDKELLIETVRQLKAYGFRVSMDDFGTGDSSLNLLKDIPFDVLKLDTEFFHGKGDSRRGEIIVKEVIRLAKELNMSIVAEGIEKKEQIDFLVSLGCDMIQGFYFAKPMPIAEFEKLL